MQGTGPGSSWLSVHNAATEMKRRSMFVSRSVTDYRLQQIVSPPCWLETTAVENTFGVTELNINQSQPHHHHVSFNKEMLASLTN